MNILIRQSAVKASEQIKLAIRELKKGENTHEEDIFSISKTSVKLKLRNHPFPVRGKGCFTLCSFSRNDVIVEYIGELVP